MKKHQKTSKKANSSVPAAEPKNTIGIMPLGDRVLVKPVSPDELLTKTNSGIIIPDTVSKEKPEQGVVIAVGPGKYENGKIVPLHVKIGSMVVFSKYGYDEVKHKDVEYYLVREENILAIIK